MQPNSNPFVYRVTIPVTLLKELDERMIDAMWLAVTEIDEIVNYLQRQGFDAYWLPDALHHYQLGFAEDDAEGWSDVDWLEALVKDEYGGNWEKFYNEFKIEGPVSAILNYRESKAIYQVLQADFNTARLEQYLDDPSDSLAGKISSVRVTGDDFEASRMIVRVECPQPLTIEEQDAVGEFLTHQCSDGWGEGFMQHLVQGYQVCPWRGDATYQITIESV